MTIRAWRSARKAGYISSGMRGKLVKLGGMFLLPLLLCVTGCVRNDGAPQLQAVAFTEQGLALTLSSPPSDQAQTGQTQPTILEVYNEAGALVQQLPLPPGEASPQLLFPWTPETPYQFQLRSSTTDSPAASPSPSLTLRSPFRAPLRATLWLPYGQAETRLEPPDKHQHVLAPAAPGSRLTLGLQLEHVGDVPLEVRVELTLDEGLRLESPLTFEEILKPGDVPAPLLRTLELPQSAEFPNRSGVFALTAKVLSRPVTEVGGPAPTSWQQATILQATAQISTQPLEHLQQGIRVISHQFPSNRQGEPDLQRLPDTVVLPNPLWGGVARLFGARALAYDPYAPNAWQTVTLHNALDAPVTLLLTAATVDPVTGEAPPAFIPKAFEVTGGTGRITTLARIPARGEGRAIIPFYVRPEVQDGEYKTRVSVMLMGSSTELYALERTLTVVRTSPLISGILLFAVPFSLLAGGFGALKYRKLMASMGARALTTIALFGALMFALGFGVDLMGLGLNALLGPFSLLVGGVIAEILHHLLLVPLLLLYPRPGTAALVGLTQYLMRGMLTGQISPVDVLFVGSALGYKELWLYGMGVTRGAGLGLYERIEQAPRATLLRLGLALVGASAMTAVTSLALHSAFYRLFYAEWYWGLTLLVAVLGPIPGIVWGIRLGQGLNRVRE